MTDICTLQETKYQGFEAYVLANGHIKACLVPDLGGKFTSIRHLSTQREWLWRNPYLPVQPVAYDASFIERYDTGGLDECFPAVSGGPYPDTPWEGIIIPDHGELWCQPWEIEIVESSAKQIILSMFCYGVRFPYRFERRLTLTAGHPRLELEYQVSNLTTYDMPFVWSIHPILNIEEGMRLSLPASVDKVRLEGAIDDFLGTSGSLVSWPLAKTAELRSLDLSLIPAKEFGQAYKLFTLPLEGYKQVETAIHDPAGEHALTFRFRPDEISHIGLWMNYGAWSGCGSEPYFNLGLEPCIGGTDALPTAKSIGDYGVLLAKQTLDWRLDLLVT